MEVYRYILLLWIILINFGCIHCQGLRLITNDLHVEIQRLLPEAMHTAKRLLAETLQLESKYARHIRQRRVGRNSRSHSFSAVSGFLGLTPEAKLMSYPAFVQTKTMDIVRKRLHLDNAQVLEFMTSTPSPLKMNRAPFFPDTPVPHLPADVCPYPQQVMCEGGHKYRTYDGCCNNLRQPLWGASFQPLARFVPPQYSDAISAPRVSVTGAPLPSPRLVSSTIHWDIDRPQHVHTLMLMLYGQFLDHDMSRTAITKLTTHPSGFSEDLEDVECGENGCITEGPENHACLPIPIPRNDTDFGYGKKEGGCLMFVRSLPVPYSSNCRLGPREQLNQLTSWLDASHIYGSKIEDNAGLRDRDVPRRGKLRMINHPAGNFKPLLQKDPKFKDCMQARGRIQCFKAGDGRVNENVALTTLHTFFAREHNRMEESLHNMNPHWDGEKLFQETRRIMGAMLQYITYNEYLPLVLGPQIMHELSLSVNEQGYWNGYDEYVSPNIGNVFATAAFRFGHSQIQGFLNMKDRDYVTRQVVPLDMTFRFPHLMYKAPHLGCDELMRGFVSDPVQTRDPFITKQVTTHLFAEEPPDGLGTDLISLNMQRAREHGLPGYNAYREWCGLRKAYTFDDLSDELPHEVISRFKRLYVHVDDIDIFAAGISEKNRDGAMIGPTFSCIIGRQFKNLKSGDRYWFENNVNNPHPFTTAQLQQIRKASLAKLMCANSDTMGSIQPKVMLSPFSTLFEGLKKEDKLHEMSKYNHFYFASHNERVPCDSIPDIDLRAWQEAPQAPPYQPPPGPPHFQPRQSNIPHIPPHPPQPIIHNNFHPPPPVSPKPIGLPVFFPPPPKSSPVHHGNDILKYPGDDNTLYTGSEIPGVGQLKIKIQQLNK